MTGWSVLALLTLMLIACGSPTPTPDGDPTAPPPRAVLPLPAELAGIPGPEDGGIETQPNSSDGELELGIARDFSLGHCGLGSPIDLDGSLWDPIGGDNGVGGELNDPQRGELINSTPTVIVLVEEDRMEMRTPLGAVITLTRHDGPRDYFLCA